jgi:hypothetical protein
VPLSSVPVTTRSPAVSLPSEQYARISLPATALVSTVNCSWFAGGEQASGALSAAHDCQ